MCGVDLINIHVVGKWTTAFRRNCSHLRFRVQTDLSVRSVLYLELVTKRELIELFCGMGPFFLCLLGQDVAKRKGCCILVNLGWKKFEVAT